jgi:hypothetical protein
MGGILAEAVWLRVGGMPGLCLRVCWCLGGDVARNRSSAITSSSCQLECFEDVRDVR